MYTKKSGLRRAPGMSSELLGKQSLNYLKITEGLCYFHFLKIRNIMFYVAINMFNFGLLALAAYLFLSILTCEMSTMVLCTLS